jgi:hypothetical protein
VRIMIILDRAIDDSSDVLWCATGRDQHQLPTSGLVVDGALVSPSSLVPDLGAVLDADLSMRSQVRMTIQVFLDDSSAAFDSAVAAANIIQVSCGSPGERSTRKL